MLQSYRNLDQLGEKSLYHSLTASGDILRKIYSRGVGTALSDMITRPADRELNRRAGGTVGFVA